MAKTKKASSPEAIDTFDEHEPELPVNLRNAAGELKTYTIGEIRDGGLAWWVANCTERFADDNNDFDGLMEDLIERCISLDGKPVPRSTINAWGDKCKQRLFLKCKEVNGIDDADRGRQAGK